MPDIDITTCTCGCKYHTGHDGACALWSNPEYVSGHRVWFIDRLAELDEFHLEDPTAADIDDLIDMRLMLDEEPECDCGEGTTDENQNHGIDCALWAYQPFQDGECYWDAHSETLQWWVDEDPGPVEVAKASPTPISKSMLYDDWGSGGYGSWTSGAAHKSCDHANQPLAFVDGTTVFPRAQHAKTKATSDPDLGFYLDSGWRARSVATFLPWLDHGLPTIPFPAAAGAIVDAFETARAGWSVEIGCIGAHGRTGTVLACMAILAGTPAEDAAQWVWDNYCARAIESEDQEWFILWFGAWHHGTVAPPRPHHEPKKPITYGSIETGSLFATPGVEGTPVPFGQDLHEGSACPACRSQIEKIKGGLGCSKRGCVHYDGLLRCRICERHVDAHPRHGHMCWNTQCKNFSVPEPKKKK